MYFFVINLCVLLLRRRACQSTLLTLVPQRLRVTAAGVNRQLYRHCSEPLEPMAQVDRAALVRARETVHIYGGTRNGARVRAVWTHLKAVIRQVL